MPVPRVPAPAPRFADDGDLAHVRGAEVSDVFVLQPRESRAVSYSFFASPIGIAAALPELSRLQSVQADFAVQRGLINDRMPGRRCDAAVILLEDAGEILALRPFEELP